MDGCVSHAHVCSVSPLQPNCFCLSAKQPLAAFKARLMQAITVLCYANYNCLHNYNNTVWGFSGIWFFLWFCLVSPLMFFPCLCMVLSLCYAFLLLFCFVLFCVCFQCSCFVLLPVFDCCTSLISLIELTCVSISSPFLYVYIWWSVCCSLPVHCFILVLHSQSLDGLLLCSCLWIMPYFLSWIITLCIVDFLRQPHL